MATYVNLTSPLKPLGNATFALLEDLYIRGSLKIVRNELERDQLDPTTIKRGMLVRCVESGTFWQAKNIVTNVDDFGDEYTTVDWKVYQFGQDLAPLKRLEKTSTSFTLNLAQVSNKKNISYNHNLRCYSCFMMNFKVSIPVKVEIFSRKDYKDNNPYTFIGRYDHLYDDGTSYVYRVGYERFDMNLGAYSILANEDDPLTTMYYFRITKDVSLTKDSKYDSNLVTVSFDYIPIEI